jgi:hypothetical protein
MGQPTLPQPPPTLQRKIYAAVDGVRGPGRLTIEPGRITFEPDRITLAFGASSVQIQASQVVMVSRTLYPPPWRGRVVVADTVHTLSISLSRGRREIEDALRRAGFDLSPQPTWMTGGRTATPFRRRTFASAPEFFDRLTGFSKSRVGVALAILAGLLLVVGAVVLFVTLPPAEQGISPAATVGSVAGGIVLGVPVGLGSKRFNAVGQWLGFLAAATLGVGLFLSPDAAWKLFDVLVVTVWSGTGISIVVYAIRMFHRRATGTPKPPVIH